MPSLQLTNAIEIGYSYPTGNTETTKLYTANLIYKNGPKHRYLGAISTLSCYSLEGFAIDFIAAMAIHFKNFIINDDDEVQLHIASILKTNKPNVPTAVLYGWDTSYYLIIDSEGVIHKPDHSASWKGLYDDLKLMRELA